MRSFEIIPSNKKPTGLGLTAASISIPLFLSSCIGLPTSDFLSNLTCVDSETEKSIMGLDVTGTNFRATTDKNGSVLIPNELFNTEITVTDIDGDENGGTYNPATLKIESYPITIRMKNASIQE